MNLRAILFALAICLSTVSHTAHAVTCAANMTASNPDAAYTDHGDGTVTHVPTGLMWKRCSEGRTWDGSTCTGTASTHTWAQALTLGSTSSFAGHADWRLPNLKELRSLVEECRSYPAINDTIFPATTSSTFWSGSPYANVSSGKSAWSVNFSYGNAINGYSLGIILSVRLVRAGQSFGSFDSAHGVALSATTLSFAAQNLGTTSAAQTVTLTNNDSAPLNIASIVASGDYAVTHNCGAGLGGGGFCTLNISFTPSATGTRTGAVTLTDDSVFSTKTIALTGTGQGAAVSLNATALYFASQNQGSTSAAQTITLTNTGVAQLNIASIVASGDFARTTTCGATLAVAANCTVSVTFIPTAAGALSGSLVITSDAASSPDTISLSGTGLAVPVVSLNPASLTFATQAAGTSSAAQTIALTNTGGAALNLTSITASGDFAVTNNCGGGLGAGGFCSLSVIFTPTAAGNRSGAITVTSNAAGSPHSASLSGGLTKLSQTIGTISLSPATLLVGGTTTTNATASSGLAVSYTSITPNVCTVSGNTVTGIASGTCTIAANQPGDSSYGPATQVTQSLSICGMLPTISTLSQTASAGGLAGNISVTATNGCSWTATSNASWITVTSGSSGNGSGSVVYSVAANSGTSSRTGTLTIAGQTFTVAQAGASVASPGTWTALPGASPSRPSLALNAATGKTQMVVRSVTDQLWMGNFTTGGTFEGWNALPGASPSVVAQAWHPGVNKMYMVARASNDQLYLGTFDSAGSFEGWSALAGASPSLVALAWHPTLNKMYMVARAANDQLYLGAFNSAGSFEGWSALSGASPSPVALAWHSTLNKMFMVARAAGDQLYLGTFSSAGSFEGWSALSGTSPSPVALAWHPASSKMVMAVRGTDDQLWQGAFSSTSGAFEGWSALSGSSPTPPVLATGQSNLQLVVRSADDQLWSLLVE